MSDHVNGWLTAYFDGELGERKSHKVEAHLGECRSCRMELERLIAMRALLQEHPEATTLIPAELFVAQVGLQLPRRSGRPITRSGLETIWRLVPVLLLSTWVFVQTLFIMTTLTGFAFDLGLWSDLPDGLSPFSPPGLSTTVVWNLGLSALIGILLLSWVASWWIRSHNAPQEWITE